MSRILSTGGGIPSCLAGHMTNQQGGLLPGGLLWGVCSQLGCLLPVVVPCLGRSAPTGQGGLLPVGIAPGGCLVETPLGKATGAGGTHPTGMHSCFCHFGSKYLLYININVKEPFPYFPTELTSHFTLATVAKIHGDI